MISNNKNTKVLILGSTGMLGSMLVDYFSKFPNIELACTYNKAPLSDIYDYKIKEYKLNALINVNNQLKSIIVRYRPDYVINCIGIIKPYCKDDDPKGIELAVKINSMFPYVLSETINENSPNTKIIQIATDCVYDGVKGAYKESDKFTPNDVYGRTKSLGEIVANNFLNIRTSIIGPEIKGYTSLLEWFLRTKENIVNGFEHHKWNGGTTLQFAELCKQIIEDDSFYKYRSVSPIFHYVVNKDVTKYELLNIFKSVFNTHHIVNRVNTPLPVVDRTLRSELFTFPILDMKVSVKKLFYYMQKSELYKRSNKL